MSETSRFKVIHEITTAYGNKESKELEAYLHAGWVLVDIHQRDSVDPQTNEPLKSTVYIVGHIDPEIAHPTWDTL